MARFGGSGRRRAEMTIATKNGVPIIKDGSIATGCGCCGGGCSRCNQATPQQILVTISGCQGRNDQPCSACASLNGTHTLSYMGVAPTGDGFLSAGDCYWEVVFSSPVSCAPSLWPDGVTTTGLRLKRSQDFASFQPQWVLYTQDNFGGTVLAVWSSGAECHVCSNAEYVGFRDYNGLCQCLSATIAPVGAECGACCNGTTCTVKPQSECNGTGEVFKGIGTTCSPNPCDPCFGLCQTGTTTPDALSLEISNWQSAYSFRDYSINGTYIIPRTSCFDYTLFARPANQCSPTSPSTWPELIPAHDLAIFINQSQFDINMKGCQAGQQGCSCFQFRASPSDRVTQSFCGGSPSLSGSASAILFGSVFGTFQWNLTGFDNPLP